MKSRISDNSNKFQIINAVLLGFAGTLAFVLWYGQFPDHEYGKLFEPSQWSNETRIKFGLFLLLVVGILHSVFVLLPSNSHKNREMAKASFMAENFANLANRDPLTSLFNRRHFDQSVAAYSEEFSRLKVNFGLFIIDIDHFKRINDTYGHDAGDVVLKEVANKLISASRQFDICCRIGGEEFAFLSPIVHSSDMQAIAERYRYFLSELEIDIGGQLVKITASIGAATNAESDDPTALYKLADKRLYKAKESGRNCFVVG